MKLIILACFLVVLYGCTMNQDAISSTEPYDNDYVSSASVMYHYMDYYVKGDELKKAMNSNEGISIISTLNYDTTSNSALFNLEMVDMKYIIATFTSENQTLLNLKNRPQAMITFLKYEMDERERLNYVGAKLLIDYVFLEEDVFGFQTSYERLLSENEYLFRIVEIRPLG